VGCSNFDGFARSPTDAGTENTEKGLIGWWSNVAVTLVNNHDIQPGHETVGRGTFPWGISGSTSGVTTQAAYAYILTHPGIPSVFILDWKERGPDLTHAIDKLIAIRKANGVTRFAGAFFSAAR
jgi:alpha-amylase